MGCFELLVQILQIATEWHTEKIRFNSRKSNHFLFIFYKGLLLDAEITFLEKNGMEKPNHHAL